VKFDSLVPTRSALTGLRFHRIPFTASHAAQVCKRFFETGAADLAGVGTFVFPKRDTARYPKAMADAQARR